MNLISYAWDFGDETTGIGVATDHTYDNPGLYIVTLTVTDFYGKEGYDTVTITVNEPEAPTAVINTVPDILTDVAPFTVYFEVTHGISEMKLQE